MSLAWNTTPTYISGSGQTEISKASGVSEFELSLTCVQDAVKDAGVSRNEIDGLVTFDTDSTEPYYLARGLGLDRVTFAARSPWGGGGVCTGLLLAALAVSAGNASCVAVYRGFNGRSTTRYGQNEAYEDNIQKYFPFTGVYGLMLPGHRFSLSIHRYMRDIGITNESLAPLSVQQRAYAATNPRAIFFEKPITIEDHQSSSWATEPVLRRLDCCLETDGSAAFIVTSKEVAKKSTKAPVRIRAGAAGLTPATELPGSGLFTKSTIAIPETRIVAEQLWKLGAINPSEIDAAILYDHFSPYVYLQMEAFGFCAKGQAADFVRNGGISLEGDLPINMNGGQLGEGYIHGMNGIAEAVRQIRGEAVNQVSSANNILVSAGPGIPTSGVILSND